MNSSRRLVSSIVAAILLAASPAVAGTFDAGLDRANINAAFEPAQLCTLNQAKGVLVRNHVKPIFTLPTSGGIFRFLGTSTQTGAIVGAAVDAVGCGFTLVLELHMKHPWCQYLPNPSERCPTSMSQ
jgi:hypothetical protein